MGSFYRMTTDPNGYVRERLDSLIEQEQKAVDKFIVDFQKDPRYALRWADSVFQSATLLEVTKQYRENLLECTEPGKWLEGNTSDGMIKWLRESCRMLQEEMFRFVRNTGQSTSVSANLLERSVAAAHYKLWETFRQLLRWIEWEEFDARVRKDFQWVAVNVNGYGMGYGLKVKNHTFIVRKRKPRGKDWVFYAIVDGVEPAEHKGQRFENQQLAMISAERDAVKFLREEEKGKGQ